MSNKNLIFTSSLIFFFTAGLVFCDPYPWEENVCNQTIPIKKDIVFEQPVQYEIKIQGMCGLVPCTKTRVETRTNHFIRTKKHQVVKATCCPGYAETPDRKCSPICLQSCNNGGKCIAPESCKCQLEPAGSSPGFAGPTCSRFVCIEVDKWGPKCDRSCNCTGNSYCSADTGKCNCYHGWYGPNCTLPCDASAGDNKECRELTKLPPIMEPEANLLKAQNLVLERHMFEPLVLNDEIRIKSDEAQDWRVHASSYLIATLSVVCFIFIVAFFVIKRKYEQIRSELCYSPTAYATSTYSQPPPYDTSSEILQVSTGATHNGNLQKNFGFAAATRSILLGKDINSLHNNKVDQRNGIVLNPKVESHLIQSLRKADQNVYTDLVSSMSNERQVPQPPASLPGYSPLDNHDYQVPRSNAYMAAMVNLSGLSANELTSSSHNLSDVLKEESNIYEEIKPRK